MAAGDLKNAYATKGTVTVTLTSLANGSARESTVIDNTSNKYVDYFLRVKTNGVASGTGQVNVYGYAGLGDTTYTDGATGTDAAFTAANRLNGPLVVSVQANAATAVTAGPISVRAAFGGTLPDKFGFIFVNNTGQALSATGGDHVVEVQGVYHTVAQS